MTNPKATGPIEIVARVNGEIVTIPIQDVQCLRVGSDNGHAIRILPGTVHRCLILGADALVNEQLARKPHEIAKDCTVPPKPVVTATKTSF